MKITALETIRLAEFANLLWLQACTPTRGSSGSARPSSCRRPSRPTSTKALAPKLLGRDPLEIDRIAKDLVGYLGFRSTGAEMRGNSALDIALWDIFGKVDRPADRAASRRLLAPRDPHLQHLRRHAPTCASDKGQTHRQLGPRRRARATTTSTASCTAPTNSPRSSSREGITAMKIWPFDHRRGEERRQLHLARRPQERRSSPFEKIRKAVGDQMDIMVEFHSMWQLLPAITIARALAPFDTFWHEDPIKMDSLGDLKRYAEASPAPICASETLGGALGLPRSPGDRRRRRRHARPLLVRRPLRSAQDRRDGRGLAPAGRAARLHRSGGARRLDAPVAQRAERAGPGERARLSTAPGIATS